jgi:hypothetical protein
MHDDIAVFEHLCKQLREENAILLGEFSTWLRGAGLATTTIQKHRYNVDFFLNHFLLSAEIQRPAEGISQVGEFLGDWFIRKAAWSNTRWIKANAASLKKFYSFLLEKGLVGPEELAALNHQIQEEMASWLGTMERYRNLAIDFDEIWQT